MEQDRVYFLNIHWHSPLFRQSLIYHPEDGPQALKSNTATSQ